MFSYLPLLKIIYIPVWLDQKHFDDINELIKYINLHSSMVRLETNAIVVRYTKNIIIYIPVWLDQKHSEDFKKKNIDDDLHSSMVRLETN